ncbi:alpha/beta hydrolase [Arsenicitalea aurantiaca]|uniref:Alpha/beta hydrolase n=1 Tax=Arsenicitalea aurantiaca TaxID=1783274 RepID=A0A433XEZ7_9HYPH|nr:alpha/beta hydrolase [Arsenicitalea aurantiaca]RUT32518.1 alpha/beta hydrolase [Arsenicitalea aurantiaca]
MLGRRRTVPDDYRAFAGLPVEHFTVGPAAERMAVHVSGRLTGDRLPVICVPGYQRNMSDFAEFTTYFQRLMREDWPVVLVDLLGRGRSTDRIDRQAYASPNDAHALSAIASALGIERAIWFGQGYGGQVLMALGAQRPTVIAGTVLVDAGPVTDSRGLVRLRNNLAEIATIKGAAGLRVMLRRMLTPDYPGLADTQLDRLGERTHFSDRRGRTRALFDPHLLKLLEPFEHDDVLVPQWGLFHALDHAPMLMMRTQLTQQLRRETFEEMMRRREDAAAFVIDGQGSPALMAHADDVTPIVHFVQDIAVGRGRRR